MRSRRPPRIRRWALVLTAALVAAAGGWFFLYAGRFLAAEDPLQRADAIFVFAGSLVERPLEAADLYQAGWAPRIVVTRTAFERAAVAEAERRGATITPDGELYRQLLIQVGVPAEAIIVTEATHDNTAEEAQTLRRLALAHGWKRVLLVSSKYHLRRVGMAARRALRGTQVAVIRRGSRYDPSTPDRWWTSRADIRWLVAELPKVAAYALALGG